MSTELCHHGVKGQKWGVRRYQNLDGSLTNAGKARRKKKSSKEEVRSGKTTQERINSYKQRLATVKDMTIEEAKRATNIHQAQINDWVTQQHIQNIQMQEAIRLSIEASNRTASLGLTGGMNPFLFG